MITPKEVGMEELMFKVRRGARPKLTEEQVRECIRLYNGGATAKKLGEQFGVTGDTILNSMRRVGQEEPK